MIQTVHVWHDDPTALQLHLDDFRAETFHGSVLCILRFVLQRPGPLPIDPTPLLQAAAKHSPQRLRKFCASEEAGCSWRELQSARQGVFRRVKKLARSKKDTTIPEAVLEVSVWPSPTCDFKYQWCFGMFWHDQEGEENVETLLQAQNSTFETMHGHWANVSSPTLIGIWHLNLLERIFAEL